MAISTVSRTRSRSGIACPNCKQQQFYKLSDGRCKCKYCHKKFTPTRRKQGLPDHVLDKIFHLFWKMVPATAGANQLGINRKTLQRYYMLLRQHIARKREQSLHQKFGNAYLDSSLFAPVAGNSGRGSPVLGLVTLNDEIWIVFPPRQPTGAKRKAMIFPHFLVCAADGRSYSDLDIDKFLIVPLLHHGESEQRQRIEHFWIFARQKLKKYRGGFKKNFELFVREMEFRFNRGRGSESEDYLSHLFDLVD